MLKIVLIILALAIVGVIVLIASTKPKRREAEERRRRYVINEAGARVPLVDPEQGAPEAPTTPIEEIPVQSVPHRTAPKSIRRVERPTPESIAAFQSEPIDTLAPQAPSTPTTDALSAGSTPGTMGRLVRTPDGDALLTTPPFSLRATIFTKHQARVLVMLNRRLPPWVAACPKVRLDTLLTPTKPDGRSVADWRAWRTRVRTRSVDLVLCDRRSWKPLVAIMFPHRNKPQATTIAGGEDKMVDEVLLQAGLPLVRLTGELKSDWQAIVPHIEQAILPTLSDEAVLDKVAERTDRVDPESAVNLLALDDKKGWLLE